MKRFLSTLFLALILIASQLSTVPVQGQEDFSGLNNGLAVSAAPPLTVQINGSVVNAPADMDVIDGQVMVPLRWMAEQLGASSVQWDPATRTVTIKTPQDFYSMEKLASYAVGLQSYPYEEKRQIWPLPEKAQDLHLSAAVPARQWVLELPHKGEQLDPSRAYDKVCIRISSEDNLYEHSSMANSADNRQGHYYLPMDWLEKLFHARVNYDQAANVLYIQTPDLEKIKSEIGLIENSLIPTSADEAVKLWGRGEQVRNGALQYAALSPQLRRQADQSICARETYWVTGGSSPWVGPITIINQDILSDTKIAYTISYPEITSSPPHTTATEKMVVEKLLYNGREGWFITQLLQFSPYGIIQGPDNILYENDKFGFSLLIPEDFMDAVEISEGNFVCFVNKEIQAFHPEFVCGVVGRIEIYDKEKFSKEIMHAGEDIYGLRYLGENEKYYFGWAQATDVQVPPEAAQQLKEQYRTMESEFIEIIKTFKMIDTVGLTTSNEM